MFISHRSDILFVKESSSPGVAVLPFPKFEGHVQTQSSQSLTGFTPWAHSQTGVWKFPKLGN